MFTRKAFGKIIGKYLFAAIILGAIGTELYAQQNQEGSLIGIGAYNQTRTASIGGINVFGDGISPYFHQSTSDSILGISGTRTPTCRNNRSRIFLPNRWKYGLPSTLIAADQRST